MILRLLCLALFAAWPTAAQLVGQGAVATVATAVRGNTPGGPGVAGGSFSPSDISGLFAWYKADALVTNNAGTSPPADSDTIKGWGDSSGNNRTLTPAASNPTWRNAATTGRTIGGFQFSATTRLRVGFAAVSGCTIFALWRNNSSGSSHAICDSTNSAQRQMVYINGADAFACYSGTAFVTTGTAAHPSYNVQTTIFLASSANETIRTNGVVAINSSDAGNETLDGLTVGSAWDGNNNLDVGDYLSELFIYNRTDLTGTELSNCENYLLAR